MHARKSSLLRRAGKVLLAVAAAGYLAIVLLMTIFQRHLVFAPRTYSLAAAQALAAQNGLAPWTNATGEVIGWKLPAQSDSAGSVLIAHGKGGSALDEAGLGHDIQKALSVDVYLLEYPGYGHRGGSPSEATVLEAADDAWQLLPTNRPAYAVSVSLGTGVAAHLAQKFPTLVAGVLMFVPYDRLASVAQHRYPFLPAYFFAR